MRLPTHLLGLFLSSPPCGGHHLVTDIECQLPVSIQSPVRGTSYTLDGFTALKVSIQSPVRGTSGTPHGSQVRECFYPVPRAGDIEDAEKERNELLRFYPVPRAGDIQTKPAARSILCVSIQSPVRGTSVVSGGMPQTVRFYPVPRAGDIAHFRIIHLQACFYPVPRAGDIQRR